MSKPFKDLVTKKLQSKIEEQKKRIYKTYGLDYSTYLAMKLNGCNICGVSDLETRLCVDHVHVAGFKKMPPEEKVKYVRGILCFICNVGLKGFEKRKDGNKNREQLEGTYSYFHKWPLKGEI